MPFIHLQTKNELVTLRSERVAENIYIDLRKNSKTKLKAIEDALPKFGMLDSALIDGLRKNKTLVW